MPDIDPQPLFLIAKQVEFVCADCYDNETAEVTLFGTKLYFRSKRGE
jgi:hypothetical protein